MPCAVCVGNVVEAGYGVQLRHPNAARRICDHAGCAPDIVHRPQRSCVHPPVIHDDPSLPLLAVFRELLRRERRRTPRR
eukprot:14795155-Alexandrium_andersonii.AAC.1